MNTYSCLNCGKETTFSYSKMNKFCSIDCQGKHKRTARINEWLNGKQFNTKLPLPAWIKDKDGYLARTHGYKCSICKIEDWNGSPIVLEGDHIDGNYNNVVPSNLRLVCPNCHSQTNNFKGKNKGNGRSFRYKMPA